MNLFRFRGFEYDQAGPTNIGTMMGHTQIAVTARERFMQAVNEELTRFEQKETEFRRHERRDRAAELNMPTENEGYIVRS